MGSNPTDTAVTNGGAIALKRARLRVKVERSDAAGNRGESTANPAAALAMIVHERPTGDGGAG